MADVILDTNVLGDFFAQFFDSSIANRGLGEFIRGDFLSQNAAYEINRVTRSFRRLGDVTGGIVVISSFAFIELFRKWEQIIQNRISLEKVRSLLTQPPDWLSIASVDETLIPFFIDVPTNTYIRSSGRFASVDWTDAIHIATALARGDGHWIATTDEVLCDLNSSRFKCC